MGKYVTKNKLKKILGEQTYNNLEQNAINRGEAFLSGQVTNAFNKIDNFTYATNIVGNVSTSALALYSLGQHISQTDTGQIAQMAKDMTMSFASSTIRQLTETATSMIATKTANLIPTISEMQSKTMSYYNEYVTPMDEIMKKILIPKEDDIKLKEKEQQIKKQKKTIEKIKTAISYVQSTAKTINEWTTTYIGMITTYMNEGPDWVANQLDKLTETAVEKTAYIINEGAKPIENYRNKVVEDVSRWAGKTIANIQNKEMEKAVKKLNSMKSTTFSKLTTKAAIAKQSAKIQILAKLGFR